VGVQTPKRFPETVAGDAAADRVQLGHALIHRLAVRCGVPPLEESLKPHGITSCDQASSWAAPRCRSPRQSATEPTHRRSVLRHRPLARVPLLRSFGPRAGGLLAALTWRSVLERR